MADPRFMTKFQLRVRGFSTEDPLYKAAPTRPLKAWKNLPPPSPVVWEPDPAEQTRRIALIACSKAKLAHRAPAIALYTGDLFVKSVAWAQREGWDIFILSARHGLVAPDEELDPYEARVPGVKSPLHKTWQGKVIDGWKSKVGRRLGCTVLAGSDYHKSLRNFLMIQVLEPVSYPLEGMQIGEQKRFLKLKALGMSEVELQSSNAPA
jgi:hypothetical protein